MGEGGRILDKKQKKSALQKSIETEAVSPQKEFDLESLRQMFHFLNRIGSCCALQSKAEIAICSRFVEWLGLPSHHDPQKNWDTVKALFYILEKSDPNAFILDAGSSGKSAILKWLSKLGFKNLYACDIRPKPDENYQSLSINFSVQDLTKTNYPDAFLHVVTCISVIEHGVNLSDFTREMHRILKPGGLLLISTDFWPDPIDCTGIYPYGEAMGEMKVFTSNELLEFVHTTQKTGFTLCSSLDLQTLERAVRWDRVNREYTFAFIALRKESV
jgi:2-polyprenyl-3-methyl-5-hydroxy-6-metoxy-1,4-benzoquinol methylase